MILANLAAASDTPSVCAGTPPFLPLRFTGGMRAPGPAFDGAKEAVRRNLPPLPPVRVSPLWRARQQQYQKMHSRQMSPMPPPTKTASSRVRPRPMKIVDEGLLSPVLWAFNSSHVGLDSLEHFCVLNEFESTREPRTCLRKTDFWSAS